MKEDDSYHPSYINLLYLGAKNNGERLVRIPLLICISEQCILNLRLNNMSFSAHILTETWRLQEHSCGYDYDFTLIKFVDNDPSRLLCTPYYPGNNEAMCGMNNLPGTSTTAGMSAPAGTHSLLHLIVWNQKRCYIFGVHIADLWTLLNQRRRACHGISFVFVLHPEESSENTCDFGEMRKYASILPHAQNIYFS